MGHQNMYLCRAMAAYAYACAKSGSPINWMSDLSLKQACTSSNYGVCTGGQVFQDCSTKCLKTCKEITTTNMNTECAHDCAQGKLSILIII